MANDLIPTGEEVKAIEIMAKNAVESKYFDKLGGYAGIFSIAMYAREMGLPIMSSLFGGMSNVLGKITIAPQMMNAMIRKVGHKLEIDSSELKCTIKGTRKDTGESCTTSFSVEDAKKAGIYKEGGGWAKYPSDMCFARALSRLARRLFPDVIGIAYVEGEIEEDKSKKDTQKEEFRKEAKEISIESEATIVEDFLADLKKKYSEHDPILIHEYCEVMASKKDLPAKAFAKECLKNSALFDNYFGRWLEKRNSPKPEIAQIEPQG